MSLHIRVTNIYTDKVEEFRGEAPAVAHDIAMAFPWLQEYDVRLTDIHDVLSELEQNQALVVEVDEEPILKSEANVTTAKDMLGYKIFEERLFDAAKWLSGFAKPKDEVEVRKIMLSHDGDMESVALITYGLDPNETNKTALKAVMDMESLGKSEEAPPTPPHTILPGTDTAYGVCQKIKKAFQEHRVQSIHLDGKHSKGSMLAKDDQGGAWIIKSGSGDQSPAAGAKEEIASQGCREAAFYHVAKAWGMADFFPAAEFLTMDGHDWAVLEMLPPTYQNIEKVRETRPRVIHEALEQYRLRGVLHRWSVIDYALGNADRHAANLMIGPNNIIKLIDHGAAFAGVDFDPGHDENSFVPFYLRYLAGDSFYEMDDENKLDSMPHLPESHDEVLARWVHDLDDATLVYILQKFGISPDASIARLRRIQSLDTDSSISNQLNQLWLGN